MLTSNGVNTTKVLGFLLLFLGVGIILFSLVSSYLIYTGGNAPPQLFVAPEISEQSQFSPGSLQDLQEQLPHLLSQQLQGLLPQDVGPRMLNFFVWSMLSGLLIFGGAMIAGIGVKLLK